MSTNLERRHNSGKGGKQKIVCKDGSTLNVDARKLRLARWVRDCAHLTTEEKVPLVALAGKVLS